jgi:hypothetical protein
MCKFRTIPPNSQTRDHRSTKPTKDKLMYYITTFLHLSSHLFDCFSLIQALGTLILVARKHFPVEVTK